MVEFRGDRCVVEGLVGWDSFFKSGILRFGPIEKVPVRLLIILKPAAGAVCLRKGNLPFLLNIFLEPVIEMMQLF